MQLFHENRSFWTFPFLIRVVKWCFQKVRKPSSSLISRPKFRSYKPEDDLLKQNALDAAKPVDIRSEVKDQLESAKTGVVIDELDITNLAPRKPDWDLKRDVAKKLEKLERRTQKAIAELIRDRLRERQDIADAVSFAEGGGSWLCRKSSTNSWFSNNVIENKFKIRSVKRSYVHIFISKC